MTFRSTSRRAALAGCAATLVAAALHAAAPDSPKPAADAAARPTGEHAAMARAEGTWDAAVEISMGPPGTAPMTSKGVETSRLCCGGLWLISEYTSDPGSPPFEGHGITGFDPGRKKYISTWVDSDLMTPMTSEGTYDPAGKTLTMRGSMASRGKTLQWRNVEVWKDDDTRQFTMYQRGPDGKESPSMSITYTRRK